VDVAAAEAAGAGARDLRRVGRPGGRVVRTDVNPFEVWELKPSLLPRSASPQRCRD
jgi:hypothetical protein